MFAHGGGFEVEGADGRAAAVGRDGFFVLSAEEDHVDGVDGVFGGRGDAAGVVLHEVGCAKLEFDLAFTAGGSVGFVAFVAGSEEGRCDGQECEGERMEKFHRYSLLTV